MNYNEIYYNQDNGRKFFISNKKTYESNIYGDKKIEFKIGVTGILNSISREKIEKNMNEKLICYHKEKIGNSHRRLFNIGKQSNENRINILNFKSKHSLLDFNIKSSISTSVNKDENRRLDYKSRIKNKDSDLFSIDQYLNVLSNWKLNNNPKEKEINNENLDSNLLYQECVNNYNSQKLNLKGYQGSENKEKGMFSLSKNTNIRSNEDVYLMDIGLLKKSNKRYYNEIEKKNLINEKLLSSQKQQRKFYDIIMKK